MGGIRIYTLLIMAVLMSGLAAMLPFVWSGADVLSSLYQETTARELESNARMFSLAAASRLEGRSKSGLRELAETARSLSGTRYTLILKDGTVVADSDEDAERMENHLNRPEIAAALAGGTGVLSRPSPTLGTDWMYVAVPLDDGAVIRAAASLEELDGRLSQWWNRALLRFAVSLAILAGMALLAGRMLSRPIEIAAAGAERYARGDLTYRLPVTGAAETRRLSEAMGVMAGELDERFRLLNRQKEEMSVVFENMSEGVLAIDDVGHIMIVNGSAQSILGLPGNASGSGVETVSRNADLLDAIRETAATDASLEREIRVDRGAGGESLVQVHTARIFEDGEKTGVLAVLRDVTRLRHLEIMRRDFVANVSHELRTPITTIQSCLETILESDEAGMGENMEFVEMALKNAKRMGAIIDNLLFLAGMEGGTAGKETGRICVSPVLPAIDEAAALCREEAQARKTSIVVECDDELTALMNPRLVVHALVNLLDNAVKYGPEGGRINVTARRDGERVRITVSDQGPGIAPRFQSRVFERFYRVDGAVRVKKGSGLGLAIVKHIALAQGGDIQLESDIGAGSRFTLSLPHPHDFHCHASPASV
ncbi:MAG: HAMP domain-containing protein [Planctomycetota bacterium]|nr:HAMP domain-containing protein [Planctomycetota bacterium]